MLKDKYFSNNNILDAGRGSKTSFIWTGIWKTKKYLSRGFRWVIRDVNSITATKDPWLARKADFKVDALSMYVDRNEKAAD